MRAHPLVVVAFLTAAPVVSAQTPTPQGGDCGACSVTVKPRGPRPPLPRKPVEELQTTLRALGVYKGATTGAVDEPTLDALRTALANRKITIRGQRPDAVDLSGLTVESVRALTGMLRAAPTATPRRAGVDRIPMD